MKLNICYYYSDFVYFFIKQVNDKVESLNGQLTSTMTNKDIHKCLIKPNAEIIVVPSNSDRRNLLCLKANGIIAKKNILRQIIVVCHTVNLR